MASVKLGSKAVGSVVTLKVNGTAKKFIVVHQGKPSSLYDSSCDGTWLLMQDIYESRAWHSSNSNSYKASTIHSYLNSTFLNLFDSDIQAAIQQVKIPYVNGTGSGGSVASGSSGLSAKIFLLSGYEVGFTTSNSSYFPVDGAKLSYFESGAGTSASNKRIAKLSGSAAFWWLRSPLTSNTSYAWDVDSDGDYYGGYCTYTRGVRPALVLSSELSVSDDGAVSVNAAPTVTSDTATGTDLGTKTEAFSLSYTVADADGDTLTVTEKLDGVTCREVTDVTSGTEFTFAAVATEDEWRKVLNGSHTLSVEVSDGSETTTHSVTFTKSVTSASITLTNPLTVDGDISVAVLAVAGSIPDDATLTAQVTNNANDDNPVWQDCTSEVKNGTNIVFENTTAANGAAFNFKIDVAEGESGTGGYITAVTGAFE